MSKKKLTGIIVASIICISVLVVTATSCTISVTKFTLTTNIIPSGAGSISPAGGEYSPGKEITLTAIPASGYTFDHWSGDASGNTSTITITMNSDKSLTAHFETIPIVPEVLYSDDFSDEKSGWGTGNTTDGVVAYLNGYLYAKDYSDPHGIWLYSQSGRYFNDFILEIETWLVDGTDNNCHMVLCRFQDESNFYAFLISADGYYAIAKLIDGEETAFVVLSYSTYIHQGQDVVNLIHIECIGSTLSLSVNGHLVWEGTDATFTGGDIALGAKSLAGNYTEIAFDNIVVSEP